MHRFRDLSASAVLCLFMNACATTVAGDTALAPTPVAARAAAQTLLPTPSAPLDLSEQDGAEITLEELLARLSKVTNVTFSASDNAGERLKKTKVALSQDRRVPVEKIYTWAESILQQNGFALGLLEGGSSPLVGVYAAGGPQSNPPATHIEPDRLEECRAHPAFLFSVVLTLPNTDVRSLGNSLRILSPDTHTGGVIPVGTTNSVILSGMGRQVADLAAMLHTINEAAAVKQTTVNQGTTPAKQ